MKVEEKNYFNESIIWSRTPDAEFPYEASDRGKALTIRVNDFPDDHFYSLLVDNEGVAEFDDWPVNWIRDDGQKRDEVGARDNAHVRG